MASMGNQAMGPQKQKFMGSPNNNDDSRNKILNNIAPMNSFEKLEIITNDRNECQRNDVVNNHIMEPTSYSITRIPFNTLYSYNKIASYRFILDGLHRQCIQPSCCGGNIKISYR